MIRKVVTTFKYKGKTIRVERDRFPYAQGCVRRPEGLYTVNYMVGQKKDEKKEGGEE